MIPQRLHNLLSYLGSHHMAMTGLLLVITGLLLRLFFQQQAWLSDAPLCLLLISLGLAMIYHWQALLNRPLMFVFHLSLLGTLAALLLSPQLRASGYFELAEGQTLHKQFIVYERGRFARPAPDDWQLTQQTINADYRHGSVGKSIRSELYDGNHQQPVVIGFMQAAHIDGYRIEPTGNMGYAAVFSYIDKQGRQSRGVVNFPGYPTQKIQSNPFRGPAGKWINASLEMDNWPYKEQQAWKLVIPDSARIKLKTEQTRFVLKPGEQQQLPSGTFKLEGIKRWLGYKVSYDPLAPIMFISSLLACVSLLLYWLQSHKIEILKWNRRYSPSA